MARPLRVGAGFNTIFPLDGATGVLTTLFAPQSDPERHIFSGGVPALSDDGATMYGTSSSGDQTHCETDRVFACGAVVSMQVDGSAPPAVLQRFAGKKTAATDDGLIWNKMHTTLYGSAYLGLQYSAGIREGGSAAASCSSSSARTENGNTG